MYRKMQELQIKKRTGRAQHKQDYPSTYFHF